MFRMNIVACRSEYRRGFDWIIGFIYILFTQPGTTSNYSAISDLHTVQLTVTHALGFSVFISRILATDYITFSLSLKITYEIFSQPNSFLVISSQSS
jgi:hypothetical protein